MKTVRSFLALMTFGLVAACNDTGLTNPELLEKPVATEFIASISKSLFAVGDTATLSFVLRNTGSDTLKMSFGMGCPVLYYVKDSDANFAYPDGGVWACPAMISKIVLAPEHAHVVTALVRGGVPAPPSFSGVLLPAGRYRAYAELANGAGKTNTITFTIR